MINIIHFLNKLVNSSNNLKPIKFIYNKNIIHILYKLEQYGFIKYNINFNSNDQYGYATFYKNNLKKVIFISKPSRIIRVSLKRLKSIGYFCILSTNQGILSNEEAIKANTGGILLFKLEIK